MPSRRTVLPRSTPAASGTSSRAVTALLDRLDALSVECHSLVLVRRGHVVAEGWWAPYSADRPHLLYSLTKSFTSVAVGLAVADGLLALDDRVVDVLPDHAPADAPAQARRLTVHHLLSMTTGHDGDSLEAAWRLEPGDLVKGFLRVPFAQPEGTTHAYDNPTTFVLARMVERVTGQGLPELLDERLFVPMGITGAEWDRVAGGASFGFHGLHLPTEAVAAFGELLLRGGRWGERQLVPRDWVRLMTRHHAATPQHPGWSHNPDFECGYGYQIWLSRHGFHGNGAFFQQCVVVPSHDLVVAVTGAVVATDVLPGLFFDCLLPGLDEVGTARDDEVLADRLSRLSLPMVSGALESGRSATARIDGSAHASALRDRTPVTVEPADAGWTVRLGSGPALAVGYGDWRESSPLGRPVVAVGAWQGEEFVADIQVVTTPHRVRLVVRPGSGTATATWTTVPLTTPDLLLHLTAPLMTRPDVS